jgi:hypothetical protein
VSWQLRHELAPIAPGLVARSIVGEAAMQRDADAMLRELVAVAPRDVASAIRSRDDAFAWELRGRLTGDPLVHSVGGVAGDRAWELRDAWLGRARLDDPLQAALAAGSVTGVAGDRAWELRKTARQHAPVAALESTSNLADDRAWRWRSKFIERGAKVVMRSLGLLVDPPAWELRERVVLRCEEVMDTIVGLDDERAWGLRERVIDRWPASVLKSLGLLSRTERGRDMMARALASAPTDLAVWRQLVLRG